ncbi:MAG: plasmid maintenance protein CcdB [Porphyrobacter sp. IPPAS B-1204]|nr:MAG: plasmid maintenance protein CcdB [Porphyrobacter sp. IPPAS B-1204]
MARFDVYALKRGGALVVDCQADLLDGLKTRVVAPLIAESDAPKPARHLNPVFVVGGERFVLMAQFLSAVEVRELGAKVGALESEGETVLGALDFLLTGV